jgi:hypothetical protein
MKNALKILSLVVLAMGTSITGLGVNVCGTDSNKIATLYRITVLPDYNHLAVSVKPTTSARAEYTYQVDLYEAGGRRRASATVVWNQIQLNAQELQSVYFSLSSQEVNAYTTLTEKQLRKTFSIKVLE